MGQHVLPHVQRKVVQPIIHEKLPLSQANDAHAAMAAGEVFGKIVLVP
ncbi:MAG TPA: zinc-binding dehydrogenase [Beutenbergiaceae bacterium]|nr:zinc-binding dehydrogenase [Beutenbergiaceae bacterium]